MVLENVIFLVCNKRNWVYLHNGKKSAEWAYTVRTSLMASGSDPYQITFGRKFK